MKKNLRVLICTALMVSTISATGVAVAFTDVPTDHWAYGAVTKLAKAHIIDGYSDGTFNGDKAMSRYELAFMVARAIEKYDTADEQQQKLIDELSKEFASELNKMGIRVTKVEAKTNTWSTGGDLRFRYHSNDPNTSVTSGGTAPTKLKGGDTFDWRARIRFSGKINENWTGNLRFSSAWSNRFGSVNDTTSSGTTAFIDVANATGKDILGFDSVKIGRDAFAVGYTMISRSQSVDGITLNKKVGAVDTMLFTGNLGVNVPGSSSPTSDGKQFTTVQFGYSPTPKLRVGGGYFDADIKGYSNSAAGGLLADNGAAFDNSTGYNLYASYESGGLTLLGEFVNSSLKNAVNMSDNPKGFAVQITNGTGPSAKNLFGNTPLTNPKKVGDSAWAVEYRRVESGTIPVGLGGFDAVAVAPVISPYNVFTHGSDNIKGWLFSYEFVPAKNMTFNVTYQTLRVLDHKLTQKLEGNKLDDTLCATVNLMF